MRNVSSAFKSAVYGQQTDEVFIVLITLDHDELSSPLRVTSDGVATTSGGNTYYPYPFEISVPSDTEKTLTQGTLTIDNVARDIVEAIRSVPSSPTITIKIVLASDPNAVEVQFPDYEFKNISYDAYTVTGDLSVETFLQEPFPGEAFTPGYFPGLF